MTSLASFPLQSWALYLYFVDRSPRLPCAGCAALPLTSSPIYINVIRILKDDWGKEKSAIRASFLKKGIAQGGVERKEITFFFIKWWSFSFLFYFFCLVVYTSLYCSQKCLTSFLRSFLSFFLRSFRNNVICPLILNQKERVFFHCFIVC